MKFLVVLISCVAAIWAKQIPAHAKSNNGLRIIGGQEARAGQFPFAAAITVQTETSQFFCGGALINNDWILTSAHCVTGAVTVTIRLGSNNLQGSDPNRITVASSHVVPHPEFDPDTSVNDIGLVKLRMPVEFTDYIQPINLASTPLPNSAAPTAIGWGQTSDDDPELSNGLNYVGLAVLSNEECRMVYGNQLTDDMVCVEGNFNEGACLGDSGSPLVVRLIGGLFLQHVGVFSFYSGNGCETTDPSGYTRTYAYIDWIRETANITMF
jgi:secreted trypsin-like serine protease